MATENTTFRKAQSNRRGNRLERLFTQTHVSLYRMTGGKLGGGAHMLILTTIGRKSGQERSTPLFNFRDGENYVIIASNGGARAHPTWWLNLQANPQAKIQLGPRVINVTAKTADAEERKRLWAIIDANYKNFVAYQKRTQREIPVVILSPNA